MQCFIPLSSHDSHFYEGGWTTRGSYTFLVCIKQTEEVASFCKNII